MKEEYKSRVSYENFIASKAITATSSGITVPEEELNPMLFDFQRDIVKWALAKGRAAIFADCGDGKTAAAEMVTPKQSSGKPCKCSITA